MARVDPAVAAARTAVRAVLADLDPGDLVLVACSGGADSLALAAATAYEARRVGRSVRSRGYAVRAGAVVVDHGLQPDSAAIARRAAEQCRDLGLDPVEVCAAEWREARSAGPEGGARAARYAAIERAARESGARMVLLGHTLDDQAEQVLLGLARGAGARSLAGMPPARGSYRRPFLTLRRAQTEAACAAQALTFWTDPTNLLPGPGQDVEISAGDRSDVARSARRRTDLGTTDRTGGGTAAQAGFVPLRSQVRGRVLPVLEETLGPGVAEALARSADQLRADADLLDALAADLLERATSAPVAAPEADRGPVVGDTRWLDPEVLAPAHPALRRRALRAAALAVGCAPSDTTARHVDALDALVVAWAGQGPVHLPGGARAGRACGRVFLRAAPSATADGQDDAQPPGTTQE